MHIPYTTISGLKIGSRYQENGITSPITDPDMLLIQEALLATPDYIRSKKMYDRSIVVSMATGIFVAFYFLLFR